VPGLFEREFLAIPPAILARVVWDFWKTRRLSRLVWAGVVVVTTGAFILIRA